MPVIVEPIEKGGSGRKFWRVSSGEESHILIRYTEARPENASYVEIARFLASVEVRVPCVYFHGREEGVILMEDAGKLDLWAFRDAPWNERRALYQRTLDQALILHTKAHLTKERPALQPDFDASLYQWEQNYFIEHCLMRHFGLSADDVNQHVNRSVLESITHQLAALPRCLVHRDFQSQNIMVRDGEVCFIDFQGLRPGLAQYDLASLLLDPYVALSHPERTELIAYYLDGLRRSGPQDEASFLAVFDLCAMQRLMQALGAYGKLGHADGLSHFLQHIAVALPRLRETVGRIPRLEKLHTLLVGLQNGDVSGSSVISPDSSHPGAL